MECTAEARASRVPGKSAFGDGETLNPVGVDAGAPNIAQRVPGDVEAAEGGVVRADGERRGSAGDAGLGGRPFPAFDRHVGRVDGDPALVGVAFHAPDADRVAVTDLRDIQKTREVVRPRHHGNIPGVGVIGHRRSGSGEENAPRNQAQNCYPGPTVAHMIFSHNTPYRPVLFFTGCDDSLIDGDETTYQKCGLLKVI